MVNRLKKIIIKEWFDYFIVIMIGIIAFTLIYGLHIVVPTYTDWLLSGGDLTQEYLGWKAFRADEWRFPFGLTTELSYPSSISVMYADPIPCLALFFKLIRGVLPVEFQYFGIWGISCFIMMGVFAYKIMSQFTNDRLFRIICATILIFSPTVIWKMYGHTPLGGQWILLFAIDACLIFNRDKKIKKMCIKTVILAYLGVSVHMYFLLMSGIILAGEFVYLILNEKEIKKPVLIIGIYCFTGLLTLYLLGGFYGNVSGSGGGLGIYSYNLNSIINPQGFSKILKDLPLYGNGQYEGMAYLGAGIIFLSLVCIILLLFSGDVNQKIKKYWKEIVSLILVLILAYVVSASNVLTINDKVIAEINLPGIIHKAWSVFRASGRVGWIISYTITFLVLIYCTKIVNKKIATGFLIACLIIQIYDLSDIIKIKNSVFNTVTEYESSIDENNPVLKYFLDDETIEHVVLVEPWYDFGIQNLYDVTVWAVDNNYTMSTFYFARDINSEVAENLKSSLETPSGNELFICRKTKALSMCKYNLHWYDAGDYLFGRASIVDGLEEVSLYSKYEIGTDIVLYNCDSYNGNEYVISGLSEREDLFSWTDEPEMNVAFISESKESNLHGQVDIANVYTGIQEVLIYVNDQIVFDEKVTVEQGQLAFSFKNPGFGKLVNIRFEFPECDSPLNRGESADARMLCLGITSMRFNE